MKVLHDMRNLVGVVLAHGELMMESSDPAVVRRGEVIAETARRLAQLVDLLPRAFADGSSEVAEDPEPDDHR